MKKERLPQVDIDEITTWIKYKPSLCRNCRANCCTMPVEVKLPDLIRMDLVSEFEAGEPLKKIARRLIKEGVLEHFNLKKEIFTLSRFANDDCCYLDPASRRCTIYAIRPNTCRNHPIIGPRPGYCPYERK